MKAYILFLFLFLSATCFAQTDSAWLKKNIKSDMDSMMLSFQKNDWNSFAEFMHPDVIKMTGGKEKFTALLNQQMKSLLSDADINNLGTGNILQLLNYNNQWQCVIESYLQMTVDSMIVSTVSSNVGITFDEGKTWKFIRVTNGNETKVRELFPGLSPEIIIPKNKTVLGVTLEELLKTYKPEYPPVVNKKIRQ